MSNESVDIVFEEMVNVLEIEIKLENKDYILELITVIKGIIQLSNKAFDRLIMIQELKNILKEVNL